MKSIALPVTILETRLEWWVWVGSSSSRCAADATWRNGSSPCAGSAPTADRSCATPGRVPFLLGPIQVSPNHHGVQPPPRPTDDASSVPNAQQKHAGGRSVKRTGFIASPRAQRAGVHFPIDNGGEMVTQARNSRSPWLTRGACHGSYRDPLTPHNLSVSRITSSCNLLIAAIAAGLL